MFSPSNPSADLPGGLSPAQHTWQNIAALLVTYCALTVLAAVFANFMLAKGRHAVQTRRKSVVETGSMLAFFFGDYVLIRWRIGIYELPEVYYPAAVAGAALLLAGTAVNLMGRLALGRNWGNQVIIYEDHRLVTEGIYRWVRHPLYAGLIWMFLGAALIFQNGAALVATVFLFIPGMIYRGRQEEKALLARFPDYAGYRHRTGMLFPIAFGPEVARVPRGAFLFCRISLTVLLWLAFWLQQAWLVGVVGGLLLLSLLLKVQNSPMVRLYQHTVLRLFPSWHYQLLDVPAMRFAHGLGALISLGVLLALLANPPAGRVALLAFCVIKTISALGFCPASKLFMCLRKGGCCALTRAA